MSTSPQELARLTRDELAERLHAEEERVARLQQVLGCVVAGVVGIGGAMVRTPEDLKRWRPRFVVEERADGSVRLSYDPAHMVPTGRDR